VAEQKWFVVRGAKEEGPFTSRQLKQMAGDGRLRPDDLVRREDVETSRPASAIKGLFPPEGTAPVAEPTKAATVPRSRSSPRAPDAEPKPRGLKKMLLIGVGVVAVLFLGSCVVVGVLFTQAKKAAQQGLGEADRMWDAGDKAGGATKYRSLIQNRGEKAALSGDERARVYGRLIDFDAERGDRESARRLLEEALGQKVAPQVGHPEAKALVAAEEARKATEQAHARGEVLTADFFPFKRGSSYRSSRVAFADYKGGDGKTVRAERKSTYEYTHEPDGAIVSRQLDHYMTPGHVTLPPLGPQRQLYREKDGYIEVGDTPDPKLIEDAPALKQNEDFMRTKWHPVVKVGALVGDEWERALGPKDEPGLIVERYKLVKIAPQEVEFKGGRKEKVTVAFVETRVTTKLDGGKTMETGMDVQLARGIGLVHQSSWGIEQGKRNNYWYEHFTPSK
jgi:hypothetical protein